MLAQNKAMLSSCGDSGTTTARAIVGAVCGVISTLQTVDSPDLNVTCICPAPNIPIACSCWFLDNRGTALISRKESRSVPLHSRQRGTFKRSITVYAFSMDHSLYIHTNVRLAIEVCIYTHTTTKCTSILRLSINVHIFPRPCLTVQFRRTVHG